MAAGGMYGEFVDDIDRPLLEPDSLRWIMLPAAEGVTTAEVAAGNGNVDEGVDGKAIAERPGITMGQSAVAVGDLRWEVWEVRWRFDFGSATLCGPLIFGRLAPPVLAPPLTVPSSSSSERVRSITTTDLFVPTVGSGLG